VHLLLGRSKLESTVISLNVGLTSTQLRELADVLAEQGQSDAAGRVRSAVEKDRDGLPPALPLLQTFLMRETQAMGTRTHMDVPMNIHRSNSERTPS
jgi:hypothetical protein